MEILGFVDIPLVWLLVPCIIAVLYKYGTSTFDFFSKQALPGPKPVPFLGNTATKSFVSELGEWTKKYGKIFGFFQGREPVFVVSDLDILKEVYIKSFNAFRNRRKLGIVPYPASLGVQFQEDEAWKRVRHIMTPAFSSGQLKSIFAIINDTAIDMQRNFSKTAGNAGDVDVKQYFGAYTVDVISRTAFGMDVNSQSSDNNRFLETAKVMFERPPHVQALLARIPESLQLVQKILLSLLFKKKIMFFVNSLMEMVKQRQLMSRDDSHKKPTDLLQLLIDAEAEETSGHPGDKAPNSVTQKRLTTDELVGQGLVMFIGGYETTASTLQFASYLLATHPDVQENVYREIVEIVGDDEPSYENIANLKYLENVILETLRLFPPIRMITRRASETITLGNTTIPKECTLIIPIFEIQRDPEVFHHPTEFIPERHDEKNQSLAFMPFGLGPRQCIGKRLALVEIKVALVRLLRKIRLERGQDTPDEIKFMPTGFLVPEKPIHLKVTPRT